MKEATFGELIKHILGGTPMEIGAKIILAGITLFWDNMTVISSSVFLYFLMLVTDAIMGAMVSTRGGKKFDTTFFMRGPLKKFGLTVGMLFVASIADGMIPSIPMITDTPVFVAVVSFIGITTVLDVARKYGKLTDSKLVTWLERKLGGYIKADDQDGQQP